MSPYAWFDDLPVLGQLPPALAAAKLREAGEDDAAARLEEVSRVRTADQAFAGGRPGWWPFQDRPWQHTAHAFGYLAPAAPGTKTRPIQYAGNIKADLALQNARVTITLDRLRVADHPGRGDHRVLFDFAAQNQVVGGVEHLHFNATYRVREGQQAGLTGYPIFVGLNVGMQGVAFKCFTVNVQNDDDETLLGAMDSDVFQAGLKLATTMQPAIAPLSGMAVALTRSIATRTRNVPVQDFYLGLDFSSVATRARLATGSYLAVQIPEAQERVWDWGDWVYHPASGQVVSKDDPAQLIPYNYVVLGVSRYTE
jgi:hypothetical protein